MRVFPSVRAKKLFSAFALGGFFVPSLAQTQSIFDRAVEGSEITSEDINRAWHERFDRSTVGQAGQITDEDILAALRRALRETRPRADRVESGFWDRAAPGERKLVIVVAEDVREASCTAPEPISADCSMMVYSALAFQPDVRRELGGAVFDMVSGMSEDGYVRWQTELHFSFRYDSGKGWEALLDPADIAKIEQPPADTFDHSNGAFAGNDGLECAMGDWATVLGC